jgi:hypothetical protein
MPSKTINGKRYNTDTAQAIASYRNTGDRRDFHQFEEALYVTPSGAFFLVGEGGPMSKYAKSTGQNSWSGSSDNFTSLTRADALRWCEDHGVDTATIETHFSDLLTDA